MAKKSKKVVRKAVVRRPARKVVSAKKPSERKSSSVKKNAKTLALRNKVITAEGLRREALKKK